MKKVFALLALSGTLMIGGVNNVVAQGGLSPEDSIAYADSVKLAEEAELKLQEEKEAKQAAQEAETLAAAEAEANVEKPSLTQKIKKMFIDGDPVFMSFVLIALIIGLALCIERIIYLNLATTNTKKLLAEIESALQSGGVEAAKEVCRNTRGPVASIFYQGLERSHEGIDMVEKSVIAYGGVQMGLLEKGLSWIALFIALAPMLGFMGTVIGMIDTFEIIESKGEAKRMN